MRLSIGRQKKLPQPHAMNLRDFAEEILMEAGSCSTTVS